MENKGYINNGEHHGDVFFSKDAIPPIMPSVGQIGSMLCPRHACQQAVWNDMDYCPFCHYNLKQYRYCQDLQYKIDGLEALSWRVGLIMTIAFFVLFSCYSLSLDLSKDLLHTIAILSFIISFVSMKIKQNTDKKIDEYNEELQQSQI